jgi:hypothetical protein
MTRSSSCASGFVRLALVLGFCVTQGSCAFFGLWHRVDRATLELVPNEEKLLLFDAENGVYIARDEMETASRAVKDTERALARAEDYGKVIEARRKSGAAIDTREVLDLLERWNDLRIEMREEELAVAKQRVETSKARLWASRARYERAKALLIKNHVPEEGTSIDMADFDEQVKEYEADEQEALVALEELEKGLSSKRATYIEVSRKLQATSKGAYGGPWADLAD